MTKLGSTRHAINDPRVAYIETSLPGAMAMRMRRWEVPTSGALLELPVWFAKQGVLPISVEDWGDWKWHVRHRLHANHRSPEGTLVCISESLQLDAKARNTLRRAVAEGMPVPGIEGRRRFYDLSVLPLNALLPPHVRSYFVPTDDYGRPESGRSPDPYGLVRSNTRAVGFTSQRSAVLTIDGSTVIGTHKFQRTLLFNVDYSCPIGCADCYKSRFGTREVVLDAEGHRGHDPEAYRDEKLGSFRPPPPGMLLEHAEQVKRWLRETERGRHVYDVIISGGEPLMFSDNMILKVLYSLAEAAQLKRIRICTGTLFMGLPIRLTRELASRIRAFMDDTGIRVTIHAHLVSHHQITPEVAIAVSYLSDAGISVHSQTPIKSGINFFPTHPERTVEEMALMCRWLSGLGIDPYMFIVDMHPSSDERYVPLEPLLAVWGALVESHDYPGVERPRTVSVLFEGGNIVLSGAVLLASEKLVDERRGVARYRIPRIQPGESCTPRVAEIFEYEEPLNAYNCDPASLDRLKEQAARAASRER